MPKPPRKMSEIMEEMSKIVLRDPESASFEADHVAIFLANAAWNECVGLDHQRQTYRNVWEAIEADKPDVWSELKSRDVDALIDELVKYKRKHYPHDMRRILSCGSTPQGTLRVEWLPPAKPGVDSRWEMQLYGLVRSGEKKKAIRYLQETQGIPHAEAMVRVKGIAAQLGMA